MTEGHIQRRSLLGGLAALFISPRSQIEEISMVTSKLKSLKYMELGSVGISKLSSSVINCQKFIKPVVKQQDTTIVSEFGVSIYVDTSGVFEYDSLDQEMKNA